MVRSHPGLDRSRRDTYQWRPTTATPATDTASPETRKPSRRAPKVETPDPDRRLVHALTDKQRREEYTRNVTANRAASLLVRKYVEGKASELTPDAAMRVLRPDVGAVLAREAVADLLPFPLGTPEADRWDGLVAHATEIIENTPLG